MSLPVHGGKAASRSSPSVDRLWPLVYRDLREIAGRVLMRKRGHTLQPTALAHEAYLRLAGINRIAWRGRTHLVAIGARAIRRALIDHERGKHRCKRGGNLLRQDWDQALVAQALPEANHAALNEALERLADLDPRQARVVELRFLHGMTVSEVAETIGVSPRTVEGDWKIARAWLLHALREDQAS